MSENGSVRAWIMENIVGPIYEAHRNTRGVDKVEVTKKSLDALETVPEIKGQHAERSSWREMRDMVNDYHTQARDNRSYAPKANGGGEQFTLPGMHDVFKDRVTIHVHSVELALNTWECDAEELRMVLADYAQRRDSLDHAMNFYRSLLYHVESRGVHKVKELYA